MKSFVPAISMILGVVLPQFAPYSFLIRYFLMAMLFLAFLTISFNIKLIRIQHFYLLVANLMIPILTYYSIAPFSKELALIAFISGIAPSAIGSIVMIDILKKDVEFVITAVLITNIIIALIIPFLLPLFTVSEVAISVFDVLPGRAYSSFCSFNYSSSY